MGNFRNFDRHKCFGERQHERHSRTIEDVRDWALFEEGKNSHCSLVNKLYGIWDGFLYDGLVEEAEAYGVPKFMIIRLKDTVTHIERYMENGGEITENEAHAINLG